MYESIVYSAKPAKETIHVCLIFTEKTLLNRDQAIDGRHNRVLSGTVKRPDVKGECGECAVTQTSADVPLVVLGLGKRKDFSAEKIRVASAGLVKRLYKLEAEHATISVPEELVKLLDAETIGRAFGEGLTLGNFKFEDYKKRPNNAPDVTELSVTLDGDDHSLELIRGLARGMAVSSTANVTRELAATPPNIATTVYIAAMAQFLAKESGLKCNVIQGAALTKHEMVGFITVGKASENPPCMIELIYTPKKKTTQTLLLIGKTISYDTGGLSIKPRDGMRGMKYDKCGGMAVLGAMLAISEIKPDFRVVGLLPTAENSVAGNAVRVDDIIRYPNGVSVEVTNTDAEGRLVLADALIYGCKTYKPSAVVDLATLTGGVVVGLGRTYAGYWCEDAALRENLEAASAATGERIWRLPMHEEYKELMKAKHADSWNSAPVRDAHPIQGAAFLSNFIDAKIPWAHIDIAGTADIDKENAPFIAGPTGFGTRPLARMVELWK